MWKIVNRLEVALDWIKNSSYGWLVAIVGLAIIGAIVGAILASATIGFWLTALLIILFLALYLFIWRE